MTTLKKLLAVLIAMLVASFAFGVGLERITMLKHGIPDLRTFFESDLRWLRHYGFSALDVPSLAFGLAP